MHVCTYLHVHVHVHVHVHILHVHGMRTPTTDLGRDRHPGPQVLTYQLTDCLTYQGRVMRTVDGRAFYLGRRAQGETKPTVSTSSTPLE